MNKLRRLTIFIAVPLFAAASMGAQPDETTQTLFKQMIGAVISNNYDVFIAECDEPMKAAMTKAKLEEASKQIEPQTRQGYDTEYFGEMNKQGYKVHIWRLRFKDGGDDISATLSIKDGKVGGFFLN